MTPGKITNGTKLTFITIKKNNNNRWIFEISDPIMLTSTLFFFELFSEEFVSEIAKIYRFSLLFFIVKKVNYVPIVIVLSLIKSE